MLNNWNAGTPPAAVPEPATLALLGLLAGLDQPTEGTVTLAGAPLSGPTPAIAIAFNHDISRITVSDNGIGMDRQWLEKYFLSIGISFYQSDEIKSVNRDPRIDIGFISQFGIGFLSSFLVAEKIVIKTRKTGSAALRITITSLKDYFDVRPLDDATPVGTEVTLHLKPSRINYCRSMEFVGYLKTNIRFLQIPVSLSDEQGHTRTIGNEPLSYAAHLKGDADFIVLNDKNITLKFQ